jgi:hypothetical protein
MKGIPDFFIVGAPRCGTTFLTSVLIRHPAVFMCPIKEPHFFAFPDITIEDFRPALRKRIEQFDLIHYLKQNNRKAVHRHYVTNRDHYLQLFDKALPGQLCGEASPSYLWAEGAAHRIRKENPQAKIIILLRNPVDRAISQYVTERRMGMTHRSLLDDIRYDLSFPIRKWGASPLYVELGLYSCQVKRYLELFSHERVFIGIFDEMQAQPQEFLQKVADFLQLPPPELQVAHGNSNRGTLPRFDWFNTLRFHPLIKKTIQPLLHTHLKGILKRWFFTDVGNLPQSNRVRKLLLPIFESDIHKLEQLIGKDLSSWYR